jgi:hypothetical protein
MAMSKLFRVVGRISKEGRMTIIGIGHKAQNGKDTAGEAIKHYYDSQTQLLRQHGLQGGLKVHIAKFAGALYEECRELHGMKEKDSVLLQNVGMARRSEDQDYWVKRAFESIPKGTNLVIFTDVRFKNEAAAIKEKGGHTILVTRLREDGIQHIATDRPASHPSEMELDGYNWDFYITSKSAALTGELAVTTAEFIRGLESK